MDGVVSKFLAESKDENQRWRTPTFWPAILHEFDQQSSLKIRKSTATIARGKCTIYLLTIMMYTAIGPLKEVNLLKIHCFV